MVRNIAVVRSPVRSASKVCSSLQLLLHAHRAQRPQRGRSQSSRYTEVYGLHFPQLSSRPAPTSVVTIIPSGEDASHPRFPAVEHVMGSKTATRDCLVVVKDSGYRPREFIVFFQYDQDASTPNQALKSVIPDSEWKGELLVMSRGSRHLVKNLRGREDQRLALLAVGGCVSFCLWNRTHAKLELKFKDGCEWRPKRLLRLRSTR